MTVDNPKGVEEATTSPKHSNEGDRMGLTFTPHFTTPGVHPYDVLEWERRDAVIYNEKGDVIFKQEQVEVPASWTQLATDIAASKYFRKAGVPGTEAEDSVRQLVTRVARTLRRAGEELGGYFATPEDAQTFEMELTHILVTQRGAFNSPVWFNCGLWHEYNIEGGGGNYYWDRDAKKVEVTTNAYEHPQNSACFIQSVDDSLDSMLELQRSEVRLFKYGSGTGSNFSQVRAKGELLSGGGESSGVLSFLEGFDRWAGSIKSGGTTRRAAKMVILDMDHPEIVDYIDWKLREEDKAKALIAAGYPADFNGEAYSTVSGQNSNNSVRIPDDFMSAYLQGDSWKTTYRTTQEVAEEYDARTLMEKIAYAAWACADPGVQFDSTIQKWHTCKNTDRINASNPCSEYLFLDDSACNLASINLAKFLGDDDSFDIDGFRAAVRVFITAMEIIVGFSAYPTSRIAQRSHEYRPLGLGYANLGALLMRLGIPYDSAQACAYAGSITAMLSGHGYRTSAEIAKSVGTFDGYPENRDSMLNVMQLHRDAAYSIDSAACPPKLLDAAQTDWDICLEKGEQWGYRNSQISVIAPTGTISFLMDCDTTGIEPEFALVKFKKLAGGGYMKIVNQSVRDALHNLGYTLQQTEAIITYLVGTGTFDGTPHINPETLKQRGFTQEDIARVAETLPSAFDLNLAFAPGFLGEECLRRLGITEEMAADPSFNLLSTLGFTEDEIVTAEEVVCGTGTVEGAPHLSPTHYPVFDCAVQCGKHGTRYINHMGPLKMMAAVQPFISGAISKTVNVPNDATVDDIKTLYVEAWRRGVKCLAVYRDGSKGSQPLSTRSQQDSESEGTDVTLSDAEQPAAHPVRRRLPDERRAIAHKFSIGGHEGYIHVGLYEDGSPGEVFLRMNKEGSVISGLMDSVAILTSVALQYGVPLESLVNKFSHVRFEPSGFTSNSEIPMAKSIMDYVFRWLGTKFLSGEPQESPEIPDFDEQMVPPEELHPFGHGSNGETDTWLEREKQIVLQHADAPPCPECGALMARSGVCYRCANCGATSGCS
ncbi:MAG: vitamin B12-dependent ribonucleotide reductase [Candidatus Poribacteria bacterium]|nr:vitamin B12-dependent ribonucleotide reductase [Candidatus Poribacteria bacterium]